MNDQLLQRLMKEIIDLKTNMATKSDLSSMATKDDIEHMATKSDLSSMATKDDIEHMATKSDLSSMATKDDIEHMATKSDLSTLATKDDLKGLATKHDLNHLATKIDRNFKQIAKNTEQLKKLCVSYKRQEKIIDTLSLRSIEHESELRVLKQVEQ
ncbi:MAG TPA: hypothetical protein VF095_07070 [Bacillota bacterium]